VRSAHVFSGISYYPYTVSRSHYSLLMRFVQFVIRRAYLWEYTAHCWELLEFKYRHDLVRDALFDIFRRAGISVKKNTPVNFLTDPQERRSTLWQTDVLVHGWVGALKATSNKVAKHEKACSDNQHIFISFAFDIFGYIAPEVVDLLKRVQMVMHSNIVSLRPMNVIFWRIDFAIQKGLAAQLVARRPKLDIIR
ncbi:auxilin-like protein, partial [Trifolium medium]|nr:auxilin-like protein [Trifolium medium]